MAWCRQATSHHLNHYWPSSTSPYRVTRRQRVKLGHYRYVPTGLYHQVGSWLRNWKFTSSKELSHLPEANGFMSTSVNPGCFYIAMSSVGLSMFAHRHGQQYGAWRDAREATPGKNKEKLCVTLPDLFLLLLLYRYHIWCHDMEMPSTLLALCEGNPPVTSRFPAPAKFCIIGGFPSHRATSNVEHWWFCW